MCETSEPKKSLIIGSQAYLVNLGSDNIFLRKVIVLQNSVGEQNLRISDAATKFVTQKDPK